MSPFSKLSLEKHPHLIADFIKCLVFSLQNTKVLRDLPLENPTRTMCNLSLPLKVSERVSQDKSKMWTLNTRYDLKCFSVLENGDYIQG